MLMSCSKSQPGPSHVAPVSAESEEQLATVARQVAEQLTVAPGRGSDEVGCRIASWEPRQSWRKVAVGRDWFEVARELRQRDDSWAACSEVGWGVVFVFSGHGCQWVGMGRELFRHEPVFRAAIDDLDRPFRELVGQSLVELLFAPDNQSVLGSTEDCAVVHPVTAALQIAAACLLRDWGVEPAAVVGHSQGEVAAAAVAGALSRADALRISRAIGEVYGMTCQRGRFDLVFVGCPVQVVEDRVAATQGAVSVAADNGPDSCVLSGERTALEPLLRELHGEGWSSRVIGPGTGHTKFAAAEAAARSPLRSRVWTANRLGCRCGRQRPTAGSPGRS